MSSRLGETIRIVVTGSEGFVGKRVVAALEARGQEAVPFDIRDQSSRYLNDICNLDALSGIELSGVEMEGARPFACMASGPT